MAYAATETVSIVPTMWTMTMCVQSGKGAKTVKIEEIIKVLVTERTCVERQSGRGCDRACERCDLVLEDKTVFGAYDAVIAMLRTHPDAQPNEPLTLEELREMVGEPVWVQSPGIPEYGSWRIVAGVDTEDGERALYCNGDYTCRDYGKVWLAYRRPPEED